MKRWRKLKSSLKMKVPKRPKKTPKVVSSKLVTDQEVASQRAFRTQLKQHFLAFCILFLGATICFIGLAAGFLSLHLIDVAQTIRLQGRLQAIEQSTPVKHTSGGIVKNVFVTDGEVVREGQILMSLSTDDLKDEHLEARRRVSELLIRSACLKAKRDGQSRVIVGQELKQIVGRLDQANLLRGAVRACEYDLQQEAFARTKMNFESKAAEDELRLLERLSLISQTLHSSLSRLGDSVEPTQLEDLRKLNKAKDALQYSLDAARAKTILEDQKLLRETSAYKRAILIEDEIEKVSNSLIDAESVLTQMESLMQDRFLYASTSGRVQRMRIKNAGTRVAAGAYLLEIAPLKTDFEVLSTITLQDLPDLSIGQSVNVQVSGGLPKPIWVPAQIQNISKIEANKRLVSIHLQREDLNKRDLLLGAHSLNGLGEQSEAMISIRSENAWRSLVRILKRQILQSDSIDA